MPHDNRTTHAAAATLGGAAARSSLHVFRQTHGVGPGRCVIPPDRKDLSMSPVTEASWQTFLQHLRRYVDEHGHARVPQKATLEGDTGPVALGRQVNTVRGRYRNGDLEPARVDQLEQLPGWAWDADSARWQDQLAKVQAWHAEHGTLTGMPARLRQWLTRQRAAYDDGELTDDQVARLNSGPRLLRLRGLDLFLAAAQIWLQDNPESTMADLTRHTPSAGLPGSVVELDDQRVDLYRRAIYYRRARAGLESANPLSDDKAARLEQLPGWTWTPGSGEDAQ